MLRENVDSTHTLEIVDVVGMIESNPLEGQNNDGLMKQGQDQVKCFTFAQDPKGGEACLVVSIDKKERELMAKPLSKTLIIKLLGLNVGFNFLEKKC